MHLYVYVRTRLNARVQGLCCCFRYVTVLHVKYEHTCVSVRVCGMWSSVKLGQHSKRTARQVDSTAALPMDSTANTGTCMPHVWREKFYCIYRRALAIYTHTHTHTHRETHTHKHIQRHMLNDLHTANSVGAAFQKHGKHTTAEQQHV